MDWGGVELTASASFLRDLILFIFRRTSKELMIV
jgi:hypothetical protein